MMCWIIVVVLAYVVFLFWSQLQKWKQWKDDMNAWIKAYQAWIAAHCQCDQDDPPNPPRPPEWPNGGWEHDAP